MTAKNKATAAKADTQPHTDSDAGKFPMTAGAVAAGRGDSTVITQDPTVFQNTQPAEGEEGKTVPVTEGQMADARQVVDASGMPSEVLDVIHRQAVEAHPGQSVAASVQDTADALGQLGAVTKVVPTVSAEKVRPTERDIYSSFQGQGKALLQRLADKNDIAKK